MKKKVLSILFALVAIATTAQAQVVLNETNFPDTNFRAALASRFGISEGDEITEAKIAATTSINVYNDKIADLTGIEHFTALTELWCSDNQLTSLDVSKNTALRKLDCGSNQLTSLDVSKNTALTYLQCWYNQLTSLDVSKNTALTDLTCSRNQLTSLDVSKNTALTELVCSSNPLTSLDVSKNTALKTLECSSNQLTLLDVSNNTALTWLFCDNNQLTSLDVSKNTALTFLSCSNNPLTSLDVSKNTALTRLQCYSNQLTSLDVSQNTALISLYCEGNQLTSLNVSGCTALGGLACSDNQLTSLNVSGCIALTYLNCYNNQFKGEAMDALVASLPTVNGGKFYVINTKDENEGNVCTKSQVTIAKGKGWTVYDYNYDGKNWIGSVEYEGSEDSEQEIDPVDENDDVDFGNDLDDDSDLNGNVIGNIFYNIGDENGEYSSTEGCIVVKKPTSDENVEGTDIFGEEFKNNFTGIVFKVPAGKGIVKVNAETTGNMLLKVKIGSNDPVEMELNGKLKVTFPYNVSEATYVYIYAGAANEAKGFGKASATDAALKIYGIEFLRDDVTGIDRPTPDPSLNGGESWYTIDGKKLNGEPRKKGVYIVKGKKVKR
ncbi:MAG: leucine-rich repeat domain-containing protein [Prevotella sp.]|nr:leucine-rich repeat domain-containing protein [Prevotella sp.]